MLKKKHILSGILVLSLVAFLGTSIFNSKVTAGGVTPEIDDIVAKMTDSIDNYKNIKATYKEDLINENKTITTSFALDYTTQKMKAKVSISNGEIFDYNFKNNELDILNEKRNELEKVNVKTGGYDKPGYRKTKNADGTINITLRRAKVPVNALGLTGEALFPQADSLSIFDNAQITVQGHENILNRDTTILNVIPKQAFKEKLKIDSIKYWIDSKTGIVIKKEMYNQGNIALRVSAIDLKIDQGVSDLDFSFNVPSNVKLINPNY